MPLRLSILAGMHPQDRLRMPSFQNARAKNGRQPAWGLGHEVAPSTDMHFIDTPTLPQTLQGPLDMPDHVGVFVMCT